MAKPYARGRQPLARCEISPGPLDRLSLIQTKRLGLGWLGFFLLFTPRTTPRTKDSGGRMASKLCDALLRVWVCEVCEQAPAHVTCKADAAALCVTCDRDIHSANPLVSRHERVPVTPFYDSVIYLNGRVSVSLRNLFSIFLDLFWC